MRAMTAYAYVREAQNGEIAEVVFKSLNSKYLDINIYRLPPERVILEKKLRELIENKISRGRIEISIFIKSPRKEKVVINKELFYSYYAHIKNFSHTLHLKPEIHIRDLLLLPGLITVESITHINESLIFAAVTKTLAKAVQFREKEGRAVKKKMLGDLRKLVFLLKRIQKHKPKAKEGELRKEDIEEEVSLMQFYTKKMEKVIKRKNNAPRGKTIDFLAQEILRELNTSASKTKYIKLSSLIIEAKNYAERIREQAQNIE